jgi:hypothetical protein
MWLLTTSNVGGDHHRIILYMSYNRTNDIPSHLIEEVTPPSLAGKKASERFVKGPIPIWWLHKAWKECRPAAVVFGLLLFYRRGMGVEPKPITKAEMGLFGITRWSKRVALEDLERAGLIRLRIEGGRLVPEIRLGG